MNLTNCLDRLVMFGMGFVYAIILFFYLPEMWKDIKEMWTTLNESKHLR